jgi:basic membrane protein A
VMGLIFSEDQSGFMAGALAGQMTESKTVGIVGGMEIPPVIKFRLGYENGVHHVCPDCTVLGIYIDSFTDPARGKEAALSQIAEGADVIFGAGGPTVEGTFKGGNVLFVAANEGVGLAPFHDTEDAIPQEVKDKLEEIYKGLADGSITTGVEL